MRFVLFVGESIHLAIHYDKPHYAVKCNPNPAILGLLAALGAGFDCASAKELDICQNSLQFDPYHTPLTKTLVW